MVGSVHERVLPIPLHCVNDFKISFSRLSTGQTAIDRMHVVYDTPSAGARAFERNGEPVLQAVDPLRVRAINGSYRAVCLRLIFALPNCSSHRSVDCLSYGVVLGCPGTIGRETGWGLNSSISAEGLRAVVSRTCGKWWAGASLTEPRPFVPSAVWAEISTMAILCEPDTFWCLISAQRQKGNGRISRPEPCP
jgi:hypothetical protein